MPSELHVDEDLVRRLPLPLAQLYRRAHNAKTPQDRHRTAFYLWEAALKLLGCGAVVEYAEREPHDPELAERLQNLARPPWATGGSSSAAWCRCWPTGRPGFAPIRDLLLGRTRDDLPRAAGLDAVLLEALDGKRRRPQYRSPDRVVRPAGAVPQPGARPRSGRPAVRGASTTAWAGPCWPASPKCWPARRAGRPATDLRLRGPAGRGRLAGRAP